MVEYKDYDISLMTE